MKKQLFCLVTAIGLVAPLWGENEATPASARQTISFELEIPGKEQVDTVTLSLPLNFTEGQFFAAVEGYLQDHYEIEIGGKPAWYDILFLFNGLQAVSSPFDVLVQGSNRICVIDFQTQKVRLRAIERRDLPL
jgi:hypothetical protein